VRRGELSPEEAEVHPQRSVITRVLGTDPDVDIDAFSVEARAGDLYLLCSDGLSTMVGAAQLEEIVRRHRHDLDAASRALVQAANRGGGEDNITAVLFEVVDGDAREADEPTREMALTDEDRARSADEEDTLHPEDAVAPPPPAAPTAVDTMVVAAADIRAAVDAADEQRVPFARKLLALLVIVVLAALIVVLVFWGLAR
jgi:protein phosphatase